MVPAQGIPYRSSRTTVTAAGFPIRHDKTRQPVTRIFAHSIPTEVATINHRAFSDRRLRTLEAPDLASWRGGSRLFVASEYLI